MGQLEIDPSILFLTVREARDRLSVLGRRLRNGDVRFVVLTCHGQRLAALVQWEPRHRISSEPSMRWDKARPMFKMTVDNLRSGNPVVLFDAEGPLATLVAFEEVETELVTTWWDEYAEALTGAPGPLRTLKLRGYAPHPWDTWFAGQLLKRQPPRGTVFIPALTLPMSA